MGIDEAHRDHSKIMIGARVVWLIHEATRCMGFTTHAAWMVRNHLVFFLSPSHNRFLNKVSSCILRSHITHLKQRGSRDPPSRSAMHIFLRNPSPYCS